MAIANISGNILTDSGVLTSSLVSGSGTTSYVPKFTGASTIGNSLIWDNGTNVGIGNTNTSYTLDVTGTGRFSGGNLRFDNGTNSVYRGIVFGATPSDGVEYAYIKYQPSAGDLQIWGSPSGFGGRTTFYNNSTQWLQVSNVNALSFTGAATFSSSVTASNFYAPSNTGFWSDSYDVRRNGFVADGTNLVFRAGNSSTGEQTRMVIAQASGNVGIGTSSPTSYGGFTTLNINNATNGGLIDLLNNGTRVGTFFNTSTDVNIGSITSVPFIFYTANTERMRITSGGIINTTSRLNVNGAVDNSLFSLNTGGTLYTAGFSPNAQASSSNTLTLTSAGTVWIYNGTGVATWTLFNPSGTNQMVWIKNAGTGIITLNAYSGTNIINNSGSSVSSITIAVGATALIQQDGNVKSYQLQ